MTFLFCCNRSKHLHSVQGDKLNDAIEYTRSFLSKIHYEWGLRRINILEEIQDQQKSTFWKSFEIKSNFKTTKYFKLPCGPVMFFDDKKTIDKSFHSKFGEKKNETLMTYYILDLWGMSVKTSSQKL